MSASSASGERAASTLGPFLAFVAFGAFWGAWAAVLPGVKSSLGASEAALGLALLAVAAGALPAMLAAGPLSDRLGRRVLAPAVAAFAAAAVLPGLAPSVPLLALALLVLGATSGTLDVVMNAAVAALETERGERLMNGAHALFSLAALVGAVSVGLARQAGAEPLAILAGVGAIMALAVLPNLGAPRPQSPRRPREPRVRVTRPLLFLGAVCAIAFLLEAAIEGWSALHLEQTLGAGPAVGGLAPGLFSAAMFAGRVLAQRHGQGLAPGRLLLGAGVLSASGLTLAAVAPVPTVALAGFALAGLGLATAAPTIFSAAGQAGGEAAQGAALSTVTTVAYLGFLLGPPLVGGVSGAAGGLRAGLVVLVGLGLALAVLGRRLPTHPDGGRLAR